jgi:hypothetical protein
LAGAGIRGIEEPLELAPDVEALAVSAPVLGLDFDASEWPGATADTSATKPAVAAADPAITQRRVRVTLASAASRARAALDLRGCPIFELIVGRENQRPVRAV